MSRLLLTLPLYAATVLLSTPASSLVTIDWATVEGVGNDPDITGFGAVMDPYRISRHEVTNSQYTRFLNAVAATPTHGLYNSSMGSGLGGITRSGSPGNYSYSAIPGREHMPVNYVSFYDALRFANWLHNGQRKGGQDDSTTEAGAYTISEQGVANNSIVRNAGAKVFLTSEDEWYKAAYYDVDSTSYFEYPGGSNAQTSCTLPGLTANTANCDLSVFDLTDVASYPGAASPNGTFDQGGNAWEWNESTVGGSSRGLRGGAFDLAPHVFAASFGYSGNPMLEFAVVGFRVGSPATPAAVPAFGPLGLAALVSILAATAYGKLVN